MTSSSLQSTASQVLHDTFGFDSFRPGQEEIIEAVVEGTNVLAVMPTGAGKSLCYQIPAIVLDGLTVVVSPLVALMRDQVAALNLAGVAADTINSSYERADNVAAWRAVADGTTKLLYLSPERLMTGEMLGALRDLPLRLIVVDEAHCVSQWGPAFRPDYEDLCRLKDLFPDLPIAAFTATADEITRTDIADKLLGGEARSFVSGFDRPNIHLAVEMKQGWKRQLTDFIDAHKGESGIVYCLSRKKTEEAAAHLCERGVRALAYHAGMDGVARAQAQDIFLTEPGVVITATIAFGMGIDKSDVRFVFHTDMPGSIEAYYQEIGRAGRDGGPAEARMLYGLDDMRMRRVFIEEEDSDDERKRREHKRLDALISYCEAPTCRRRMLLTYFGEDTEPCGNCDMCLNPAALSEGTIEGQKALSAVARTGQRFGATHITDVLRGQETEKVMNAGHNLLPTFGAGADHGAPAWRSILRQLVAANFLKLDIQGYGSLKITEDGRALLRGEREFHYRTDAVHRQTAKRSKRAAAPAGEPMSEAESTLLMELKALRLELARARSVPAYVIFSDKTLEDMARKRPQTRDAFADVFGVGEAKLREFAEPFLALIGAE
jgi:ATP-dependent DNA helicase RecQ